QHRRRKLGLLVVDYVQLVKGSGDNRENRRQVVSQIGRDLKELARALSIPVLALAQLDYPDEKRYVERPMLSDLREDGSIARDGDVVSLLHRPDYYDPNAQPGLAEVHIARNRNGRTGVVELGFRKEWTRFDSPARYAGGLDDNGF